MRARRLGPAAAVAALAWLSACHPHEPPAGRIAGPGHTPAALAARTARHAAGAPAGDDSQILFGDLHVHSTYSTDAFLRSLPIFGGEGAHPPADACDFARWCAGLDFFAMTDHAEGLTPALWAQTKQSVRDCNARSGDPANPDLVAFTGFEWTQTGPTPDTHYGHKNVIFRGIAEEDLPARPISAVPTRGARRPPTFVIEGAAGLLRLAGLRPYGDLVSYLAGLAEQQDCDPDADTRSLPPDCRENAETPTVLFRKLDEWGFDALVIPHGLAWGIHSPPGTRIASQLTRALHDPKRQRLLEVASGHGNGESWRDFPEPTRDAEGALVCPKPTPDFLPCCWRAGELARARCADPASAECAVQVHEAQQRALASPLAPHLTLPGTRIEDWLDCDQCRDCFKPVFMPRPGASAQAALAASNFDERDEAGDPLRFHFGFIASSDNHTARAATGYKQWARLETTDASGIPDRKDEERVQRWIADDGEPAQGDAAASPMSRLRGLFDTERGASFLYPGGTVAVHAHGRDRDAIWDALERREVYGTSGPRMLLWFDLLNGPTGGPDASPTRPMGSEVTLGAAPRFRVRAVGAAVQRPGCPAESLAALGAERLHALCLDECVYPSRKRTPIAAIEVVRVLSPRAPDEPLGSLIADPWQRHDCPPDPAGCTFAFSDPELPALGRDAAYYVRALQVATPAVNGANLRTRFDAQGDAISVDPCTASWRTPADDDCLAPVQERAWSSPIYVDTPRASAGAGLPVPPPGGP